MAKAGQARVLIVDDDPDFAEATKSLLESKKYKVLIAPNGDEGVKKAKLEKPDVIVLDVIMPGKDGFAVSQELKASKETAKIPVLLLTSYYTTKDQSGVPVSGGMAAEAEDYVDKPVEPKELVKRIERLLRR